jgi:hypothetical protein
VAAPTQHGKRIRAMVSLLQELAAAHEELLQVVEGKIEALRRADAEGVKATSRQEDALVERINDRESLRRQLAENIVRGYGVAAAVARRLSAAQLAERIGGAEAELITTTADRLKGLMGQIDRRNQVARTIAQGVLGHLQHVFQAMTEADGEFAGYSPAGIVRAGRAQKILDAVG